MAVLGLLLFGIIVFGTVVLFVWAPTVDIRTGSGYGLCILSSVLLACTFLVVLYTIIAVQLQPGPYSIHHISPAVVFYFVLAVYAVAFTLVGVVIVTGKARHWHWIGGFLLAVLVPVALPVPPHPSLILPIDETVRNVGLLGLIIAPEATVLAYSITRLGHPVAPSSTRQVAPPHQSSHGALGLGPLGAKVQ
jgi:hypothetical protein